MRRAWACALVAAVARSAADERHDLLRGALQASAAERKVLLALPSTSRGRTRVPTLQKSSKAVVVS